MEQRSQSSENRQQLIDLLSSDFEPPDGLGPNRESGAGALGSFIAQTRVIEEIEVRAASAENQELGDKVDSLLEPAPISYSFKKFITNSIRRAHAWQTTVDDVVAPDRLGIGRGEGIFAPDRVQDIEAQVLRGALFDTIERHMIIPSSPRELHDSVLTLSAWRHDYRAHYGEDAFADLEDIAFIETASNPLIIPDIISTNFPEEE